MSENIKIYKKTEEGYPKTLLQLPDAPARIYVLGELPDPTRPAIAIVGARNCSSYGKNMAYEYARVLTKAGVQVISGLAIILREGLFKMGASAELADFFQLPQGYFQAKTAFCHTLFPCAQLTGDRSPLPLLDGLPRRCYNKI